MKVSMHSPFDGKPRELDIPSLTLRQYEAWKYSGRIPIQVALPHLTADEREFLLNGYLPGEIDEIAERAGVADG